MEKLHCVVDLKAKAVVINACACLVSWMRTGGKLGVGADNWISFAFRFNSLTTFFILMCFLYATPKDRFIPIGVSIERYPLSIITEARFGGNANHDIDGFFEVFEEGVVDLTKRCIAEQRGEIHGGRRSTDQDVVSCDFEACIYFQG